MLKDLITIDGQELRRIWYRDEPVITLPMIDQLHQRPEGTAKRNFWENRERFQEGRHYSSVPYEEWKEILSDSEEGFERGNSYAQTSEENQEVGESLENGSKRGGYRGSMYFLTERGYLLIVKSLQDDLAWEIYEKVVDTYFRARELLASPQAAGLLQEMTATRHEIALVNERLSKIEQFSCYTARTCLTLDEKLTAIAGRLDPELPISIVDHPLGGVRLFLIDEKVMVLGSDFLVIHTRTGSYSSAPTKLMQLGFARFRDFKTMTAAELGRLYGVMPGDVMTKANLGPVAQKLTLITPTGMAYVKDINIEFYDWYIQQLGREFGKLLKIHHLTKVPADIREREA